MTKRTALILGATGGIGGAMRERLLRGGWHVKALTRRPSPLLDGCEQILGDAMEAAAVLAAAQGAAVIVHAVNPPGYRNWSGLVLPMIDNSIAAAQATGARIVLPGTVYNYGPDAFPAIDEDAPQHPRTRKGAIRVALEERLRRAAEQGPAKALIVRAGDYFGPGASNNWFGQAMVTPGARPRVIRTPGKRGVGHQWAYLPDVAETMAQLLDQPALPAFARFHMDGQWDADGRQMAETIARVLGDPAVPIRPLPWWQLRLAALAMTTPRELMEMRYLWQQPIRLRNARLVAALGAEPRTPLVDAVAATLTGLGCR
ncbi:NAD-dependent epimerase/dehydratase family protein [Sphingomonas sp. ABOLD]|uniref:NAD-dependent epimerase/dehydratase family protein n=1 Tax=unclassified Sphingomonas TaxID=196159 RepID=UPI000F7E1778|nr:MULTISPECIES: NAD-dependent epimerase/dehydratase family protein [unclassified Sphingomonas]RSV39652.1 NAD-dependent epimerase/dehydratase family protein [Sphingomonas sp. ABOLE]RSV47649.1 NAD-dependent epimerase/dehydratase family protein [Sphingomonas sp. ABOLD]